MLLALLVLSAVLCVALDEPNGGKCPHSELHVVYLCPDVEFPSGGIKTLYKHVSLLNQRKLSAYIMHSEAAFGETSWHGYTNVPVIYQDTGLPFEATRENCIMVLPESALRPAMANLRAMCILVGFSLNWSYMLTTMLENGPEHNHRDYVDFLITNNHVTGEVLHFSTGLPVTFLAHSMNEALFHLPTPWPPTTSRSPLRISYPARKSHSGRLSKLLLNNVEGIEWVEMLNFSEKEYAELLRVSDVYLATGEKEGNNLSVLEAMACGCLVIGFTGIGGRDYMIGVGEQQNSILVENGDDYALAQATFAAISNLQRDPLHYQPLRERAVEAVANYTVSLSEESEFLARMYRRMLSEINPLQKRCEDDSETRSQPKTGPSGRKKKPKRKLKKS